MSPETLTALILEYRYWILIPLCFLEGPIVAFAAGALASLGYFNVYALAALFFVRDLGMDGVYYYIGWRARAHALVKRLLAKIRIDEEELGRIRELWMHRPWVTMFLAKVSYGIASTFIMLAGMIEMPLKPFFGYGALVTMIQYGGLLVLGYEYGAMFGTVSRLITNFQYAILILAILGTAYFFLNKYFREKLKKAEEGMED